MTLQASSMRKLRRPLALAIALAVAPLSTPLLAQTVSPGELPRVGVVKGGQVNISFNPAKDDGGGIGSPGYVGLTQGTTITQTSKGAIINWGSFSIGAQNSVTFVLPTGGVTLNRVIGFAGDNPTTSNILGKISASQGSVFLVNPAGALFGAGSTVNVGSLVASTLSISDADFNTGVGNGHFVFNATQLGTIVNAGNITVNPKGTVALLATQVQNQSTIKAPQGTIALGAGNQITLDIGGDGLTQLNITVGANSPGGVTVSNTKPGVLTADGGQVLMQAVDLGANSFAGVVNAGLVQARSLESRGGHILLSSSSDTGLDAVGMSGQLDVSGTAAGVTGGNIDISGYDVAINHDDTVGGTVAIPIPSIINTSGATGGGTITVNARDVLQIDPLSNFIADATVRGNGGSITLYGVNGLYGLGSFSAQGGANGGNGGRINTSGGGMDLDGIRINASAPGGIAGTWTVDPYDVTIVHGNTAGSLPGITFAPLTDSTIQDGDINNALNNSTNVTISTGTGAGAGAGNIIFNNGVAIERTTGTAPLTFELDAYARIQGSNFSIVADPGTGPLTMLFDSDAGKLLGFGNGGINFLSATLRSNGGDIRMYGQHNATTGFSGGIDLGGSGMLIDTRVNGSNTAAAGNLLLRGHGGGFTGVGGTGVILGDRDYSLPGMVISTGTGNIDVVGVGDNGGDGIALATSNIGPLQLITSSGHIALTGFGSTYTTPFAGGGNGSGISTSIGGGGGISLQTGSGTIDLRGYGLADTDLGNGTILTHDGLSLGAGTQIRSNNGNVLLTGSSLGSGVGVDLLGAFRGALATTLIDAGSGTIVLRAHNSQTSRVNPLQVANDVSVRSSGVIDIRPGSVDAAGNIVENPTDLIVVGASDTYSSGINVASLNPFSAGTLVLGSDRQAGDVSISGEAGDINYAHNLTLYAGGGGNVRLNGGVVNVGANTLALIAGGSVSQTGAIIAGSLLATALGGNVQLANPANNVSAHTVAGSAAGTFTFYNSGDLGIGSVNATGFGVAANAPTTLSSAGITGNTVLMRSMAGNVLLDGDVSGTTVNLVTGPTGVFLNPLGNTIRATGYWHVWASSWIGETRGGVSGNGNLPNLYGCTFGTTCAVTPSAGNDQFIYIARPTVTVDIANGTREYGLPNGVFGYTVNGLILGDQAANALTGTTSTDANQASNVGSYAIDGNFLSPAGYLVNVFAGTLAITPATLTYIADPYRRMVGVPNGVLGGSVSGFRNGDTLASSTDGTLVFQTGAGTGSPVGSYAIDGSGLSATNYIFTQANGNAVALTITPPLGAYTLDFVRDTPVTYVYDRNFGIVGLCPATDLAADARDKDGDTLAREWSRVRSRPNLANCVSTKQKNSCGDF